MAKKVVGRIREEEANGRATEAESDMACRKVMATARVLAENRREQKRAIDARRGREEAVHVVDVDIDTVRLKAALELLRSRHQLGTPGPK